MPYSYAVTTASGVTAAFTVPFPYESKSHVHVLVDNILVPDADLSWPSPGQVILPTIPPLGAVVKRYRSTPATSAVTFVPGRFDAKDLNIMSTRLLYVAQEALDGGAAGQQAIDQILGYLDTIGIALEAAQAASVEAVAANVSAQEALEAVQALRDEVEALVGVAASAVSFAPSGWLTPTNVQAALELVVTTVSAKLPLAGGSLSGSLTVGGDLTVNGSGGVDAVSLEVTGAPPEVWLNRPTVKRGRWLIKSDGALAWVDQGGQEHIRVSSAGAVWTQQLGDLAARISAAEAYAGALANDRVQIVNLGGAWSGTRPSGGVVTSVALDGMGGTYVEGKFVYYYKPTGGYFPTLDV